MYKTSAVKKPVWLGQSSATPARFATSHAILNQLAVRWIYERTYYGSAGASAATTIGVRDEDPSASTLAYTAERVSTHSDSPMQTDSTNVVQSVRRVGVGGKRQREQPVPRRSVRGWEIQL